MKMDRSILGLVLAIAVQGFSSVQAGAQPVEKVADLTFVSSDGVGFGGYAPLDRFTQVGTNLWFTTSKGGTFDAGTVSRFDLVTRQVVEVASLDNNTGKAPESSLLVIGDEGYFTTLNGGTGNAGTIARINFLTGVVTPLFHFPANNATARENGTQIGSSLRASLTRIGDDLWTTSSLGGSSNRGSVVKFNLTTSIATLVANLDGPERGGQAYAGIVEAQGNYYFTTAVGGDSFSTTDNVVEYTLPGGEVVSTTNNLSLGAGTLMRLSFNQSGDPVFTRLVNLRGGFEQFSYSEPVLIGTNDLYFATIGPNATPGSIMRYDLSTGASTNIFVFPTNEVYRVANGTRPGFNGLMVWQDELYFINRLGGASNVGAVVRFNPSTLAITKLADLKPTASDSLGSASTGYNSGTVVEETNRFFAYFPVAGGGANGFGTIIRVALPPPPIIAELSGGSTPNELTLTWTGGYEPFAVQRRADAVDGDWEPVVEGLTVRTATVPIGDSTQGFFRIVGSP